MAGLVAKDIIRKSPLERNIFVKIPKCSKMFSKSIVLTESSKTSHVIAVVLGRMVSATGKDVNFRL